MSTTPADTGARQRALAVEPPMPSLPLEGIRCDLATLAAAVEHTAEAIIITDASGVIEYVNPAFARVTGYDRAEVVGQTPRILKSGRQDRAFYDDLWAAISDGKVWRGRFMNRRKDGTLFEEEGTISPVRDASGRIAHFVAVKRDVTREAQLEEQVRHAMKMEAIGRLAAGVAHDFNNVLNVVLGHAELAARRMGPEHSGRRHIDEVKKAAAHGADLTRQLLDFGRREPGASGFADLNHVLRDVHQMLLRVIGDDVELRTVTVPGVACVRVHPTRLAQILMNLVVNARDAMPAGGRLTLETSTASEARCVTHAGTGRGPWAALTVRDTGTGMDAQTARRAFEPFFTTKPEGSGTGLGLSTVYQIVERSGGHIAVESRPGEGTTFRIFLPLADGEA